MNHHLFLWLVVVSGSGRGGPVLPGAWGWRSASTTRKATKTTLGPLGASTKPSTALEASLFMPSSLPSRRHILSTAVGSLVAAAATAYPTTARAADAVTTTATCDTTVSVWQNGRRLVYLLGTAHISEQSATLARQLVRDTHPQAVFVELDLRRVAGVSPDQLVVASGSSTLPPKDGGSIVSSRLTLPTSSPSGSAAPTRVVIPQVTPLSERPDAVDLKLLSSGSGSTTTSGGGGTTAGMGSAAVTIAAADTLPDAGGDTVTATTTTAPAPASKPNWFQSKLTDWGAALVGKAIRGLYSNLGQAGFSPGEEFVAAVQEGQAMGSDIVLGDQDVQITLRRLSQALAVTDLNALTDPNSDLERSMGELFGNNNPVPALEEGKSAAEMKAELANFVETMKSRDKVRQIMGQLRQVAPALVQVMLTERDAYMATGLDTLQDYEIITAVMGLAHIDGVERNLRSFGWKPVKLNCPARAASSR